MLDMTNGGPRSIPFGVRVKLNANGVVREAQGRHGITINPQEQSDEWIARSIEANPSFNVVLLDGEDRPTFLLDRSLDLVECLDRCVHCEAKGGYLVVVDKGGKTLCVDCHEMEQRLRQFVTSGRAEREDFHAD